MHSHLRFENPPALPHDVVVEILERALGDRDQEFAAADALVGIALRDEDLVFIERCCLEVGARAEADPSDVDRRALDGLDDVRAYLRRGAD